MGIGGGCRFHQVLARRLLVQSTRMHQPPRLHSDPIPAPPVWRRLFHLLAASSIPTVAIFTSSGVMVPLMATLSGVALVTEAVRLKVPSLNRVLYSKLKPLLKVKEDRSVTGATYVAISALISFLLFDEHVAIVSLFFLSFGDPAAALVGGRICGWRVFGKSPIGSVAFFIVALVAAWMLSASDVLSFHWGLVIGAAVAALVELVPTGLDDNITIPLISGAVMTGVGV